MAIHRPTTRQSIRWVVSILVAVVILPVVGGYFAYEAEKLGWYTYPAKWAVILIPILARIASQNWFHWGAGAALGFVLGIWVDTLFLRRRDSPKPIPVTKTADDLERRRLDLDERDLNLREKIYEQKVEEQKTMKSVSLGSYVLPDGQKAVVHLEAPDRTDDAI